MVKIEIQLSDEEFAAYSQMAAAERRSVEDQVAYYAARSLKRSAQNRKAAEASWEKRRTSTAPAPHMQRISDAPAPHMQTPPPLPSPLDGPPPSPFSSPTPPSNPPTSPPIIPPSFPTPTEIPFSEPLEGPSAEELPEIRDASEKPSAEAKGEAEPLTSGTRPAPKPRRQHEYTPAFEKFWKAYPGGGDKQPAFVEWKAAGLERDEELRERVGLALQAQIEDRRKCAEVGIFYPEWKDAERWLKKSGWEAKLRYAAPATASALLPAVRPSFRAPQRSVAEVGQSWIEKRRQAGL